MQKPESFTYLPNPDDFQAEENAVIARIPSGIASAQELVQALKEQLKFPYFGNNWDSLDELLRDFSWLNSKQIVIIHQELPLQIGKKNLVAYLEVLLRDIQDWKRGDPHELVVVFPSSLREEIQKILQ